MLAFEWPCPGSRDTDNAGGSPTSVDTPECGVICKGGWVGHGVADLLCNIRLKGDGDLRGDGSVLGGSVPDGGVDRGEVRGLLSWGLEW